MKSHSFAPLMDWFPSHCDQDKLDKLYQHWQLMLTWNARTNLTAIKTDQEALLKHYADSIIMTEILPETGRVLDVGSGGGVPGLPLAVVRDDLEWTLLEPRQKRVSFLRATIARLGLKNVTVVAGRSDETPRGISDIAVTRATFSDVGSARTVLNWLVPGGSLYALRSLDAAAWPDSVAGTYRFGEHVRRIDCLS